MLPQDKEHFQPSMVVHAYNPEHSGRLSQVDPKFAPRMGNLEAEQDPVS